MNMMHEIKNFNHLEISGDAIIPVIRAFSLDFLSKKLLTKYQLENVTKGKYYNMQKYLNLLHEVEHNMPRMLYKIGEHIFTEAVFPPQIKTLEEALQSVDVAYYMNHNKQAEGEIGHYHSEKVNDDEFVMTLTNPYPCNFDQGIIQGIANKFKKKIVLRHDEDSCRQKGDSECKYFIKVFK
jgi:predicted hydrocarbon binding protein